MEESIPEMLRLRDEGKIRFLGITCLKLHCLRYVLEHSDDIDVVLTFGRYNLMDQALVGYFDDLRAKKGFALLNCSVLFMGILSKSVIEDRYFSMQGRREHDPEYGETVTALKRASDLCDAHGVDLGSLAFQFGCDCPFCDSTVVSMGRTARLDQNMALWKEPYDRALAEEVRQILAPYNCITRSFRSVSRW